MNDEARQAFADWKDADAQARGAETRLAVAWETYFSQRREPPSRDLVHEVSSLRAVANERLSAAMKALGMRRRERPSAD